MPHDPEKYLEDALDSCEFLMGHIAGRGIEDYRKDRAFRSAAERELQIVGEAVFQLTKLAPEIAARIAEHERIVAFRHILVHGYYALDPEIVWFVLTEKVPELALQVRTLLDSEVD